ncbi:MAG: glycosyltransferase family 4 protein [Hyphomicrobiales bacterium]|nr:glycosyltransferase family 4 protein [Acidobacteriaceae bacterium]MBV9974860.1 glycosyltransferase family 4 protein [Hyphomicrobiales bacterium]
MQGNRIVFISTMEDYSWGGSEELWSRAAIYLADQGVDVHASVLAHTPLHQKVLNLSRRGIDVRFRPKEHSFLERAWRKATATSRQVIVAETERLIAAVSPHLVVYSDGGPYPTANLMDVCLTRGVPFVTIGQANWEYMWPADEDAERLRVAMSKALRCYFVSKANMRLAEKQLGGELANGEVVWNPFNVDYNAAPLWPTLGSDNELQLACVARLEPVAKGHDLLLEALATPLWATRNWRLNLYGEGPVRNGLERLATRLGLGSHRVVFAGHRAVEDIWASNHVLVMASRYEGLPLAMVEAMLCGRPVVATDVAGHSEIIQDEVTGFLADAPTASNVGKALERMWVNRSRLEEIGKAGATRMRSLVPPDPAKVFTEKIKCLLSEQRSRIESLHVRRQPL